MNISYNSDKYTNELSRRSKANWGITLIALVITVIVLLILAGVAVSMTLDQDGLFRRTNNSVEKWNAKVAEDENTVQNALDILYAIEENPGTYTTYTIGQLVNLGTESNPENFYVIETSDTKTSTVKLLAETSIKTIAFDNTEPYSDSYEGSTIKTELENYKTQLQTSTGKTINEARLMKLSELEELGADPENNTTKDCPEFVHSTAYWLETSGGDSGYAVWNVQKANLDLPEGYTHYLGYFPVSETSGLRPVIIISKSQIE